jgi:hypothetical protein
MPVVSPSVAALAREVELLKEQITSIFSLLGQQARPRDPSIDGFCQRHGISRRTYLNLRYRGKAPREAITGTGGRVIITESAEAEWIAEREAEAAALNEQRKVARGA